MCRHTACFNSSVLKLLNFQPCTLRLEEHQIFINRENSGIIALEKRCIKNGDFSYFQYNVGLDNPEDMFSLVDLRKSDLSYLPKSSDTKIRPILIEEFHKISKSFRQFMYKIPAGSKIFLQEFLLNAIFIIFILIQF